MGATMNEPDEKVPMTTRDGNDEGFILIEVPEGTTEVIFDGNGD